MDYPDRNCRQTLITSHATGLAEISSGYMFCNNLEAMKQYHRQFKSQIKKSKHENAESNCFSDSLCTQSGKRHLLNIGKIFIYFYPRGSIY